MYREKGSSVPGAAVWWGRAPASGTGHRVLPDGCMDLIWIDQRLLVAGPDTRAHASGGSPGSDYAGIRFPSGSGPTILGLEAHELCDQRIPLADLWPAARVRRLTEQLGEAPDAGAALEEIAVHRLRRSGPPEPIIGEVVNRLRRGTSIAATAEAVGVSDRQLYRRSRSAFGYGPKTLARILRMNRALDLARTGTPLAAVAAAAGYADQAHLAREVRALAGVPITALLP